MSKQQSVLRAITQHSGAQMMTLEAETKARLRIPKGHPLYNKQIIKRAIVNGVLGANYERSVNRKLEKEGAKPTFKARERNWGENIKGLPLVTYHGSLYLRFQVLKRISEQYYVEEGKKLVPLSIDEIKDFIVKKEEKIEVRNYEVDNIIKVNGKPV